MGLTLFYSNISDGAVLDIQAKRLVRINQLLYMYNYCSHQTVVCEASSWTSHYLHMLLQASTLTQNGTRPLWTSNTEDLLVLQKFYWSYKFLFNIKRKKH